MEQRAEPFGADRVNRSQRDDRRRHEIARRRGRNAVDDFGRLAFAVSHQPVIRRGVDHRANIGRGIGWIADDQRIHRPAQHFKQMIGDILLNEQQPQCRTALSC